ncbi:hypothetical protein CPLU01_12249 [Colletotrichum plurivorum]|uniref:Conidiation-specific protein 6 n=1 Tax=Colletotrichum plurivorum TaxID=2175906 RepID=A0A8H6JZ09_9PEZI|nr:hypothetical protein CPLU01_12249 [Colletotrichum plurivorum]
MAGDSKVGTSGVYEAGDQRNAKNEEQHAERFHEGKDNSHQANDSSTSRRVFRRSHSLAESDFLAEDQRSIANRLAAEEVGVNIAKMHGNEPSSGAKIDAQLQAEDEQRLREKAGK